MSKTVVGLFSTVAQAEQVKEALLDDGYDSQQVKVVANGTGDTSTGATEGIGEKIGNFFRSLIGGDEVVHDHYATGVNAGGALLAVTVEDEDATEVAAALKEHGARDIDGGYQQAATSGTPVYGDKPANSGTDTVIPVVEEQLVVGKREVDRGGVRIYSHLTERPAEADVTLREERVNVERRPVDRPATAADFEAGRGGAVELFATGEEAVVGKTSRVVEEVLVGKTSNERTEAVRDTVRKTEVNVEELEGQAVKSNR